MQPATNTTLSGCACENTRSFFFAYVGSDQRLYQFMWDTNSDLGWQTLDLISEWQSVAGISLPFPRTAAGARSAGPISMSVLEPPPDNTGELASIIYLFYIDVSGHIQALHYPLYDTTEVPPGGSLTEALNPDLTLRTGAPPAAAGSGLASYGWASAESQHVVYVGTDGNVWELYQIEGQWDEVRGGPLWQANNLSERTGFVGVLAPKKNSPLAGAFFTKENSEHVIYIAGDNTIRELWFYNGTWGGNNLSEAAGAASPAANSPLQVYAANYEDTLHVIYLATDGAIHELWWDQSGWQPDHNISQIITPGPTAATDIAAYACEYEQSEHIIYVNTNNQIMELYHINGQWGNTNLSNSTSATAPASGAPLVGYAFEATQQQHIYYLDDQTRAHELVRDKSQWYSGETA